MFRVAMANRLVRINDFTFADTGGGESRVLLTCGGLADGDKPIPEEFAGSPKTFPYSACTLSLPRFRTHGASFAQRPD
jgi:hypothetical protein